MDYKSSLKETFPFSSRPRASIFFFSFKMESVALSQLFGLSKGRGGSFRFLERNASPRVTLCLLHEASSHQDMPCLLSAQYVTSPPGSPVEHNISYLGVCHVHQQDSITRIIYLDYQLRAQASIRRQFSCYQFSHLSAVYTNISNSFFPVLSVTSRNQTPTFYSPQEFTYIPLTQSLCEVAIYTYFLFSVVVITIPAAFIRELLFCFLPRPPISLSDGK